MPHAWTGAKDLGYLKSLHNREPRSYPEVSKHIVVCVYAYIYIYYASTVVFRCICCSANIYIYAYSFRDNSTCGLLYRIVSIFRLILLRE